jgi:hypothetical protein
MEELVTVAAHVGDLSRQVDRRRQQPYGKEKSE